MQSEDIKVAICDDEEFYRSQLDDMVSVYVNEMDVNVSIDLYGNAKELMNNILSKSKEYDLLFLDVEMPGMTGIEMADAKKDRSMGVHLFRDELRCICDTGIQTGCT